MSQPFFSYVSRFSVPFFSFTLYRYRVIAVLATNNSVQDTGQQEHIQRYELIGASSTLCGG